MKSLEPQAGGQFFSTTSRANYDLLQRIYQKKLTINAFKTHKSNQNNRGS